MRNDIDKSYQDKTEEQQTWWQKNKPRLVIATLIIIVLAIAFALAVHWFGWGWTGFNSYSPPTSQYQRGKTLWDWLQLLIIPLILAIGGFWLNQIQKNREEKTTEQRDNTERGIAKDNQQEALLQAYIDKISELFLKEHLGDLTAENELKPEYMHVRNVARVRTITVLTQLDARRLSYVFAFLREAGLMSTEPNDNVVSLKNADLRTVNWSQANLSGANLSGANLSRADLSEANLSKADLSVANLQGADLSEADLSVAMLNWTDLRGANLREADLSRTDLREADLRRTDLQGADLSEAFLSRANLREADLRRAKLNGAFLSRTDLSEANLRGTDLSEADLSGAMLNWADLRGANLHEADLSRAILKDATSITPEELEKQAKSLKDATMPDGSIHC